MMLATYCAAVASHRALHVMTSVTSLLQSMASPNGDSRTYLWILYQVWQATSLL